MPDSRLNQRCAVILTAIPVEYQAIRAHLLDVHEETHPQGIVYERGQFPNKKEMLWDIGIIEVGAGNADTAVAAERAITHFNPSLVLFVGVAGGLKDVNIGDVVAATKVYGYEAGKAGSQFEPRPDIGTSTFRMEQRARADAKKSEWLQRIKASIPDPPPRVFVAPIASGDQVLASTSSYTWQLLRTHFSDAVAVEMEGRGLLRATRAYPSIDVLIIRGISDLIEGKKEADALHFQHLAARHASAFAFEILATLDVPSSLLKEGPETSLAPQPRDEALARTQLDAFHQAMSPIYQQIEQNIYTAFTERNDISPALCDSAIKIVESLNEPVRLLAQHIHQLSYIDRATFTNIREKIAELLSALHALRRLPRMRSTAAQKREFENGRKRVSSACEQLLTALDHFRIL